MDATATPRGISLAVGELGARGRPINKQCKDGTPPPPHRDFKERSVVLAVTHPRASTTSYLSSQFLTNSRSDLHATSRSSQRSRPRSFSCCFILWLIALLGPQKYKSPTQVVVLKKFTLHEHDAQHSTHHAHARKIGSPARPQPIIGRWTLAQPASERDERASKTRWIRLCSSPRLQRAYHAPHLGSVLLSAGWHRRKNNRQLAANDLN